MHCRLNYFLMRRDIKVFGCRMQLQTIFISLDRDTMKPLHSNLTVELSWNLFFMLLFFFFFCLPHLLLLFDIFSKYAKSFGQNSTVSAHLLSLHFKTCSPSFHLILLSFVILLPAATATSLPNPLQKSTFSSKHRTKTFHNSRILLQEHLCSKNASSSHTVTPKLECIYDKLMQIR